MNPLEKYSKVDENLIIFANFGPIWGQKGPQIWHQGDYIIDISESSSNEPKIKFQVILVEFVLQNRRKPDFSPNLALLGFKRTKNIATPGTKF